LRIRWEEGSKRSFRDSVMRDQAGALAVMEAIDALAGDPLPPPPLGEHRGSDWHRLHVGPYRVTYFVDGEDIAIRRVDKVL
jgi:mRNA-degrading endonuclease RelE of RelBE toxin-antitoxin system